MRKKKTVRKRKATHGKKKSTHGNRKAVQGRVAPNNLQVSEDVAEEPTGFESTGFGPDAAGQSGDIEGLSTVATGDSESVAQLVEEGQDLEAEKISGVENAPEPDQAEVRTHNRGR
jgi:hypothetical protein